MYEPPYAPKLRVKQYHYKDGLGIKLPMSVDVPFKQRSRNRLFIHTSFSWRMRVTYVTLLFLAKVSLAQQAGAVEYTDCISAEEKVPTPTTTSVRDMTLWSFEEC